MSIKVQRVSGTIADTANSLTLTAPTDFTAVSALSSAFVIPANSLASCGTGSDAQTDVRTFFVSADLTATDSITFQRGGTAGTCPVAAFIVEFTGTAGDQDEFVMRGKTTTTVTAGLTTIDSSAISGIGTLGKVVPFMSVRMSNNSGSTTQQCMLDVEAVNDGSNNVNRFTRLSSSNNPVAIVYNVEWIHANTIVQTALLNNVASSTNVDKNTTISAVAAVSRAWVYSVMMNGNGPDDNTFYAWLTSTTNVRTRMRDASAAERLRFWVIENPTWTVQHISAVDGTDDWESGVVGQQVETVPCTVVDPTRALILGHAGSHDTANTSNPAQAWRFGFDAGSGGAYVSARRNRSAGASEYALNIIEFAQASAVPAVTAVSSITDGVIFTITGTSFGASQGTGSVVIGSAAFEEESQTIQSWSDTSITCIAVQGTNPFTAARSLIVTKDGGVLQSGAFAVSFSVPDNQLATFVTSVDQPEEWRFVPVPDMEVGDQIHVRNVIGLTFTSQLTIAGNATWLSSSTSLVSFEARLWDAVDETWGTWGLQTIVLLLDTEPQSTPVPKALFCPGRPGTV